MQKEAEIGKTEKYSNELEFGFVQTVHTNTFFKSLSLLFVTQIMYSRKHLFVTKLCIVFKSNLWVNLTSCIAGRSE